MTRRGRLNAARAATLRSNAYVARKTGTCKAWKAQLPGVWERAFSGARQTRSKCPRRRPAAAQAAGTRLPCCFIIHLQSPPQLPAFDDVRRGPSHSNPTGERRARVGAGVQQVRAYGPCSHAAGWGGGSGRWVRECASETGQLRPAKVTALCWFMVWRCKACCRSPTTPGAQLMKLHQATPL